MKQSTKELIKYSVKEFLMTFVDLHSFPLLFSPTFERRLARNYFRRRNKDSLRFSKFIHDLKRRELITEFVKGKERYFELTDKAIHRLEQILEADFKPRILEKWDGRWRMVVFDIPVGYNTSRDRFRFLLKSLGFYQLQASVYVYPFECRKDLEITFFLNEEVRKCTTYLVADIIEGEGRIINYFLNKGILQEQHLKRKKN